jgi:hypothetical protein
MTESMRLAVLTELPDAAAAFHHCRGAAGKRMSSVTVEPERMTQVIPVDNS